MPSLSGSHAAASLALVAAILFTHATPAHAQMTDEARARLHFGTATSYYDQGRYIEAAAQFREAYQLSGRSHILLNVSRCFELASDFAQAASALEEYLIREPNARDRRTLEQRVAQLRAQAGPPPTTSSGGGGGDLTLSVILLSVGGALALGGVGTGIAALEIQSSVESRCGPGGVCDPTLRSDVDTGQALAITTDVLIPTGLAAAALGTVFLIIALGESGGDTPAPTAACTRTGCMAGVRGSF